LNIPVTSEQKKTFLRILNVFKCLF
jgi:hypothetical protein